VLLIETKEQETPSFPCRDLGRHYVINNDKEFNTVLVLQLLLYIIATTNLRTDTLTYYTKRTAEGCAFYLLSVLKYAW